MKRRHVGGLASIVLAFAAAAVWLADPLPQIPQDDVAVVADEVQVERGRYLARAGNCIACHTAAGETPYSGGRAIETPFGDVYSTNLTPDIETGLGAWTAGEFWRAMHHGRSRDGRRLYPAFPYNNYTQVSRADTDAIFAYLRSLPPASKPRIAPRLRFPYDSDLALRVWRALYFRAGEFTADPQRDAQWNRGAYLVEGLGHCNACHTARTRLGGLDPEANYAGGPIPMLGWDALPLTSEQPMSDEQAAEMEELLHAGTSRRGVVSGPMAEVVFQSLQYLERADIAAMVAYIRTLPRLTSGKADPPLVSEPARSALLTRGETIYREHCAGCHGDQGEGRPYVYPALAGNRVVNAPSASNAIRTVLHGGFGPSTAANPQPYGMPPYEQRLSSAEIAAVLSYIRAAWGNDAAAVAAFQVERH